jgi:hypothetical protein
VGNERGRKEEEASLSSDPLTMAGSLLEQQGVLKWGRGGRRSEERLSALCSSSLAFDFSEKLLLHLLTINSDVEFRLIQKKVDHQLKLPLEKEAVAMAIITEPCLPTQGAMAKEKNGMKRNHLFPCKRSEKCG